MGKLAKISVIKKDYNSSNIETMQGSLSQKGLSRVPGTGVFKFPYKELDGTYRTGLDPQASYIQRIQDPTEREFEQKRVGDLKVKLEQALGGVDLSPRSKFWNYALTNTDGQLHAQPVKLLDSDNYFDLNQPLQEIAFSWLRVHPTVASSLQAYEQGKYPSDTQFYVADDEMENEIVFKKKQLVNKAIVMFEGMSPVKRKKIARILGLPVTDNTKEEVVYNMVDKAIRDTEVKSGDYKGLNPVEVFTRFANMQEQMLHVKDLVEQAVMHSIYRIKANGRLYRGEYELALSKDEWVKKLLDDDNQSDLIELEQELKGKKLAAI